MTLAEENDLIVTLPAGLPLTAGQSSGGGAGGSV